MRETLRSVDHLLLSAVVALCVFGAGLVYSASFVVAHTTFDDGGYFFYRQLVWLALGLAALVLGARLDYRLWQRVSFLLLALGVIGLVLVLTPALGTRTYGAQRWFSLPGGISLQPSEFAKLAVVIYFASWAARRGEKVRGLTFGSLPFAVILGVVSGLVMLQPDLGTTVVIVGAAVSIFFVAGANLWHFALGIAAGALLLQYLVTQASYRLERWIAWTDPWQHAQTIGYHTIQTLIALGSGGLLGVGLGASRQKTGFLPNPHTDAIFAILGEELGFVGTLAVVVLFAVIAWRGLWIAFHAADPFGRLLATGITAMLIWQAAVNLAVTTNTLPYTGVTLPFLSYGGSSLLVSLGGVGLLLSVSRRVRPSEEPWWRVFFAPLPGDDELGRAAAPPPHPPSPSPTAAGEGVRGRPRERTIGPGRGERAPTAHAVRPPRGLPGGAEGEERRAPPAAQEAAGGAPSRGRPRREWRRAR